MSGLQTSNMQKALWPKRSIKEFRYEIYGYDLYLKSLAVAPSFLLFLPPHFPYFFCKTLFVPPNSLLWKSSQIRKSWMGNTVNTHILSTKKAVNILLHWLPLSPVCIYFCFGWIIWKLQAWSLTPKYFSLHLLRGTTIPLSHLGKLSVILYCHLIFRPHSNFPSCPKNVFYSFFVVIVIIVLFYLFSWASIYQSSPLHWLLWKRRETSPRKTDLI